MPLRPEDATDLELAIVRTKSRDWLSLHPALDVETNAAFLAGSDALEGYDGRSYADITLESGSRGHAGALLEAQNLGGDDRPISAKHITSWHAWISAEQDAAPAGEFLPLYPLVELTGALSAHLGDRPFARQTDPLFDVNVLADNLLAFHQLSLGRPHAGQLVRLLANYLVARLKRPTMVFAAAERDRYARAFSNPSAARVYLSDKLRAFKFFPGIGLLARTHTVHGTDFYGPSGLAVDRTLWDEHLARWTAAAHAATDD